MDIRNPSYHQHIQRYLLLAGGLRYLRFGEWKLEEVPCRRVSPDGRTTIVTKKTVALAGGGHTLEGIGHTPEGSGEAPQGFLHFRAADRMPIVWAVQMLGPEMRKLLFPCIAGGERKMSVDPTYNIVEFPSGPCAVTWCREALTGRALSQARADARAADEADGLAGVAKGLRFFRKSLYPKGLGLEAREGELIGLLEQTLMRGRRRLRGDGVEEYRSEVDWNGHTFPHLVVTKPLARGGRAIVDAYPDVDLSWAATVAAVEEPVHGLISRMTNLWVLWHAQKAGLPPLQLKQEQRQRLEATYLQDFDALSARIDPADLQWHPTLARIGDDKRRRALTTAVKSAAESGPLSLARKQKLVKAALSDLKNPTNLKPAQIAEVFSAWPEMSGLKSATLKKLSGYVAGGTPDKRLLGLISMIDKLSQIYALNYITVARAVDDSWGKPL